jgi:hypothetical protein
VQPQVGDEEFRDEVSVSAAPDSSVLNRAKSRSNNGKPGHIFFVRGKRLRTQHTICVPTRLLGDATVKDLFVQDGINIGIHAFILQGTSWRRN